MNHLTSSPCCCTSASLFPRLCFFFFSFLGHPWWSHFPSPRVTAPTLAREWHKTSAVILWEQQATHSGGILSHTKAEAATRDAHTCTQFSRCYCRDHGHRGIPPHRGYPGLPVKHTHESGCGTLGSLLSPLLHYSKAPVFRNSSSAKSNNYHLIR